MTPHVGQAGITENDAYPLLRYRTAKTESEKKAWMDFINYHHPELSKQLKEEQANGQPSN